MSGFLETFGRGEFVFPRPAYISEADPAEVRSIVLARIAG
jgi:hypothetical protein